MKARLTDKKAARKGGDLEEKPTQKARVAFLSLSKNRCKGKK